MPPLRRVRMCGAQSTPHRGDLCSFLILGLRCSVYAVEGLSIPNGALVRGFAGCFCCKNLGQKDCDIAVGR